MKLISRTLASFALASSLTLGGCGYTLQGAGTVLPPDVKVVSIPLVRNGTTQPSLTPVVTEALRDRFERFGVVSVVEDDGTADAKLDVQLLKIVRKSSSLTSDTASALSYDLTLTVAAALRRPSGQLLWQSPSMSVSRTYGAVGNVVVTSSADFSSGTIGADDLAGLDSLQVSRGQERETLNRLAEDLAKKIYDDAVAEEF